MKCKNESGWSVIGIVATIAIMGMLSFGGGMALADTMQGNNTVSLVQRALRVLLGYQRKTTTIPADDLNIKADLPRGAVIKPSIYGGEEQEAFLQGIELLNTVDLDSISCEEIENCSNIVYLLEQVKDYASGVDTEILRDTSSTQAARDRETNDLIDALNRAEGRDLFGRLATQLENPEATGPGIVVSAFKHVTETEAAAAGQTPDDQQYAQYTQKCEELGAGVKPSPSYPDVCCKDGNSVQKLGKKIHTFPHRACDCTKTKCPKGAKCVNTQCVCEKEGQLFCEDKCMDCPEGAKCLGGGKCGCLSPTKKCALGTKCIKEGECCTTADCGSKKCDVDSGQCVECLTNQDCAKNAGKNGKTTCNQNHVCDCPPEKPHVNNGQCVECTETKHCNGGKTCQNNTCKCNNDTEEEWNGECRPICTPPMTRDQTSGKCLCPDGVDPKSVNGQAFCCKDGKIWQDGTGNQPGSYGMQDLEKCGCPGGVKPTYSASKGKKVCCQEGYWIDNGERKILADACKCPGEEGGVTAPKRDSKGNKICCDGIKEINPDGTPGGNNAACGCANNIDPTPKGYCCNNGLEMDPNGEYTQLSIDHCGCPTLNGKPSTPKEGTCCANNKAFVQIDGDGGQLWGWRFDAACGCPGGVPPKNGHCCQGGKEVDPETGEYTRPSKDCECKNDNDCESPKQCINGECLCPDGGREKKAKDGSTVCCNDDKNSWNPNTNEYDAFHTVCGCPSPGRRIEIIPGQLANCCSGTSTLIGPADDGSSDYKDNLNGSCYCYNQSGKAPAKNCKCKKGKWDCSGKLGCIRDGNEFNHGEKMTIANANGQLVERPYVCDDGKWVCIASETDDGECLGYGDEHGHWESGMEG